MTLRQRDYIEKVQSSGQHLLGIINDILDFSKVEAGKLTIEQVFTQERGASGQHAPEIESEVALAAPDAVGVVTRAVATQQLDL